MGAITGPGEAASVEKLSHFAVDPSGWQGEHGDRFQSKKILDLM
ncbi:MAG: hypothetical protein R3F47_03430 [Gammaproteobacteria bacterium]|jgi:hypothetical protein